VRKTGPVEIVKPRDIAEAVRLVKEGGRPLAGGTDLFVRIRKGIENPPFLVYLGELPELQEIRLREEGAEVGAAVTHAELLRSPLSARVPILRLAISALGAPAIREMGTLAGNLANASPAGDGLIPLYLLEATVRLAGPDGEREIPVEEFVLGPGKTALRPGEIIRSLWIPFPEGKPLSYFRKVGRRRALFIAIASLGALVWLEGDVIGKARLALGSVAPTVLRPREVERTLVGLPLEPETLRPAAELLSRATRPISDLRASADYRRKVAGNLLLDMAISLSHRD